MKRKDKKKSQAEFPFLLYFPAVAREVSKRDGTFHGVLMSDAYAPRTREAALSWLEEGKKQLAGKPAWDRGVGYSYFQRRHFLRDPKSPYCVDFKALVRDIIRCVEHEDWDAFLEIVLAFFDEYPIFEGAYGWVPWMARGITVTPAALACWNCTNVTPCGAEDPIQEPHCCDNPKIEPFCHVTLHYVGVAGLTKRRMSDLKDPIEKRVRAKFKDWWDPRNFVEVTGAHLLYGEKTGRKQSMLERDKELQRISDHAQDYKEEIRKAMRNPEYESSVIRRLRSRLRKRHLGFDLTLQALTEELIQEELDEYTRTHPKVKVPKAPSLLKRPKRKRD